MEVITLYSHSNKTERINREDDLMSVFEEYIDEFGHAGAKPNCSVLWQFHKNITEEARDEYGGDNRKLWGLMFLCRIMPPYLTKS